AEHGAGKVRPVDIGVEANLDGLVEHLAGAMLGALRQTAIAGHLAEEPIERDGGEGEADHGRDQPGEGKRGQTGAPSPCFAVLLPFTHGFTSRSDWPIGDMTAQPDDGDDEEQHNKAEQDPSDGQRSLALTAFALLFDILHHNVRTRGSAPPTPKACSTSMAANSRKR